jgi:hypothetical protein
LDLKSVREETGRPVSTWTRMISFRMAPAASVEDAHVGTLISRVLRIAEFGRNR